MRAPAPTTDAPALAGVHASAFDHPWAELEFDALLQAGALALAAPGGMVLLRVVADEAEILTLAVEPDARGQGLGRRLVDSAAGAAAKMGARTLFLEVSEDNDAALALYASAGFARVGTRRAYYKGSGERRLDALLLSRTLNTEEA